MRHLTRIPPLLLLAVSLVWIARIHHDGSQTGAGASVTRGVAKATPSAAPSGLMRVAADGAAPPPEPPAVPPRAGEEGRRFAEVARAGMVCDDFRSWLRRGGAAPAADSAAGRARVERRREALRLLLREDPARAYAAGLTFAERETLPPAWLPLLEERFSTAGDVEVIPSCGAPGEPPDLLVTLTGAPAPLRGQAWGELAAARTKRGAPVEGIALEGWTALAENGARPVKGRELEAALRKFPAAPRGAAGTRACRH